MFTLRRILGTSAFLLAGLVLAQADCGDDTPMSAPDLSTMQPPDLATPPDLTSFAAPTVTAVSPVSGVNNVPTALSITGTNFRDGAVVTVGGQPCTGVVVSSPTSISCTAPVRTATCGAQDVVVTNPSDMQSGTGSKLFRYVSRAFSIGAITPVPTGTQPNEVLAVDLNNDGKLDLVNTNRTSNTVSVSLGNGDGTFMNQTTAITGVTPVGVAAGDMNGDGKLDLITANFAGGVNTISYLAGNGQGGFANKVDTMIGTGPIGVAIADARTN
jgi:hypothetical protein